MKRGALIPAFDVPRYLAGNENMELISS